MAKEGANNAQTFRVSCASVEIWDRTTGDGRIQAIPRHAKNTKSRSTAGEMARSDKDEVGIQEWLSMSSATKMRAGPKIQAMVILCCPLRYRLGWYTMLKMQKQWSMLQCSSQKTVPPGIVKVVAAAMPDPSARIATIFVEQGGYGTILNTFWDETTDRHFHVPATAEKALAPEELEYLKVKGCFTLPEESDELVKAYFQFVHPAFPVIDGSLFIQRYAVSGREGINLLLLWSMFSVSASYIPNSFRITHKEKYAHHAKLLFDLNQEKDKIVLVQSALLLSFWFADTEDVKQSWYWTSIAFNIGQTLGLHREIRTIHTQITARQRSLGMGRPLRVNASDCDCPVPEGAVFQLTELKLSENLRGAEEVRSVPRGYAISAKKLYSSTEAAGFLRSWRSLITTSNVLREILANKTISTSQAQLFFGLITVQETDGPTFLLTRVDRHLKLHQNAAMIALARACGWKEVLKQAADRTTDIIQALLDDYTTTHAAPDTIPLLVPAMVYYLNTSKSRISEQVISANDKLNTCTNFLTAIKDNYLAAHILKQVLSAAQDAILTKGSG
ncbi:hypothetical protein EJ02DRAFT_514647 [Clathrospora elynae]|uniref:Xylanolytic transcriptional activator regulatory domain-containing protein n=1 Tax=Clathrospora elynae TaxID=706981 RepID=A0A6A5SF30_9PLEO|nr:hypothetical protein EJ02DRAFT_514647 [Clathrospora elynae]